MRIDKNDDRKFSLVKNINPLFVLISLSIASIVPDDFDLPLFFYINKLNDFYVV